MQGVSGCWVHSPCFSLKTGAELPMVVGMPQCRHQCSRPQEVPFGVLKSPDRGDHGSVMELQLCGPGPLQTLSPKGISSYAQSDFCSGLIMPTAMLTS